MLAQPGLYRRTIRLNNSTITLKCKHFVKNMTLKTSRSRCSLKLRASFLFATATEHNDASLINDLTVTDVLTSETKAVAR